MPTYPLDVLGAETQGMVGYLIEQELGNRLPDRLLVTVLTMVEVDPADPAFADPTKPVGPQYDVGRYGDARGRAGMDVQAGRRPCSAGSCRLRPRAGSWSTDRSPCCLTRGAWSSAPAGVASRPPSDGQGGLARDRGGRRQGPCQRAAGP